VLVEFNQPCNAEEDPTVDHIVTLTRRNGEGLWIPDIHTDRWTPSHPEKHTELFTSGTRQLRRLRARVTRLAKAWNKQWDENDRALSSFNVEALTLEYVQDESMSVDAALTGWFAYAASEIGKGETKDPARVSEPIRLPLGQNVAARRLSDAAKNMVHAMEHDHDRGTVTDDLSRVFWKYVKPSRVSAKNEFATVLRGGNDGVRVTKAGVGLSTGTAIKATRSFGGDDA
jgi:hypothetical protein